MADVRPGPRYRLRPRRCLGAVVALVLLVPLAGCGLFRSKPGPDVAARTFLTALASGDTAGAAQATDDPAGAKALLDRTREALKPAAVSATLGRVTVNDKDQGSSANATYQASWDLGHGRILAYQNTFDLRQDDGDWKVHWVPSVLHPKLGAQQSLALRVQQPDLAPVLDANGAPLLTPDKVVAISLDRGQAGDLTGVATSLAGSLSRFDPGLTPQSLVDGANKTPDGQAYPVLTLRDADYQQVRQQIANLPGVRFAPQTRLLASDKNYAGQVLGAVRRAVDDQVAGKSGWRVVTVNAAGAEVEELAGKPAEPAQAVTTTIIRNVQNAAEAAVDPVPQPAVLVAMRPSTGELLAVAQNAPADAQGPIALSGRFPPGSTFKIVTATAALESGKVTPDTPEPCPGTTQVNGHEIPNEDKFDKGVIPLHAAFAFSCNTTFAQVATRLSANALTNTAKQLGIGVDFDMPGATTLTGGVPPASDSTERAVDGFGQGKDIVSPFGMALAAATVARGTMPMPTLLRGQAARADASPPPVPQPVLNSVRQMMREVVAYGTATHVKDIPDVAGKTGTAQFGDGVHSHGWFVGFRGDLAFAVLLLGADSSTPAVDVAGAFLRGVH
ncbi:penicillin-binding transpeptidase domain-containing protein [Gandjariella thermophila]|uniref:penicillin-binding transpeptidase domain-containing protein n=1 Tax=Gandjariella thermophila TaxID=1931992 RepID=UPI001CEF6BA9|nr:penicillin-binding transpeptidase domain-containing protein [Gandjariella thermophila]